MYRVQSGIGALHLQSATLRNQQDVGLVTAALLIQELPRWRQVHAFALSNIFEKNYRVRHPSTGADYDAFQVSAFMMFGVADLLIFADRDNQRVGHGAGPSDSSGHSPTINDRDHLILALGSAFDYPLLQSGKNDELD